MALKITKEIKDDSGNIYTNVYGNVGRIFRYDKLTENLLLNPCYFRNQESYIAGEKQIDIASDLNIFNITIADASGMLLFDFLYGALQKALIKKYSLVQGELWSDKTGTWQQVTI